MTSRFRPLALLALTAMLLPGLSSCAAVATAAATATAVEATAAAARYAVESSERRNAVVRSTSQLRSPRGLRTLRAPRAYGAGGMRAAEWDARRLRTQRNGSTASTATSGSIDSATYSQDTANASLQVGQRRLSWENDQKTLYIQSATSAGLYGSQPATSGTTYTPTTGTWSWQR